MCSARDACSRVTWPWPADTTAEHRARRVATSYRQLAAAGTPPDQLAAPLAALDAKWSTLGETWIKPRPTALFEDDWVSAAELAQEFHINPRSVWDAHRAGHIRRLKGSPQPRYSVGDFIEHLAAKARKRAKRGP